MSSTTVTIRINATVKRRLENLAKSTGRSRSYLAAEAIGEFVDANEWQIAGIKQAIELIGSRRGRAARSGGEMGALLGHPK